MEGEFLVLVEPRHLLIGDSALKIHSCGSGSGCSDRARLWSSLSERFAPERYLYPDQWQKIPRTSSKGIRRLYFNLPVHGLGTRRLRQGERRFFSMDLAAKDELDCAQRYGQPRVGGCVTVIRPLTISMEKPAGSTAVKGPEASISIV